MKIKTAYRFELADHKKSIIIFYLILLLFYFLLVSSSGVTSTHTVYQSNNNGEMIEYHGPNSTINFSSFSGVEFITVLFLFFVGYSFLKSTFGPLIQNSTSRKTIFISHCLSILSLASMMALINEVILVLAKIIVSSFYRRTYWLSFYESLYKLQDVGIGNIPFHITNYFYTLFLFLFSMAAGFLVSLIYYRIGRTWKIILNVTIIMALFMFNPSINRMTDDSSGRALSDFFDTIFGVSSNQPVLAMITFTLTSVILGCFSWLLFRKAVVKD